ncbi:tripartite tricarboxylate transporter TctB family protein [Azospirillum sp. BE72]|uniref:tripartite tricarboxylate transporter TctB family protein n=1 Tax=Azospirillum sp. BE72 TaxID=2817776 RepID=UPI002858E99B|nr:tripartite tricarboxylate transporter TctB family protein [Azospirillum sp. BE72]MDR6771448.1 small-conductance mechanosensitive channel [Azospirillum sp. BE72]
MTHTLRSPRSAASRLRSPQDLAAGLLLSVLALGGLWLARGWEAGSLAMMQAGFFPRLVCYFLLAVGLATMLRGLTAQRPATLAWAWRPSIAITIAVIAFAALLDRLGLVLAILALIGIGGLAGRPLRPGPFTALWATLATSCIAIFSWGLGLPLQIWP